MWPRQQPSLNFVEHTVTLARFVGVQFPTYKEGRALLPIDVEQAYRRYGPMVLRRCRHLLVDEQRALDAMQDTFVQVLRYATQLDGDHGSSSLLYRIATNVCLNRMRGNKRRPEDAGDNLLATIAQVTHDEERSFARRFLARAFANEPSSTQVIAVLHYVDGLTLEEVAQEVSMSVSGVRKRLRTLRARLEAQERGVA